jgi:hypothetical protein
MDIKNITGLEKPLQKLVEVVAEGIGETANAMFGFDAKKIQRIGAAQAEAEKTEIIKKAEAQSEALKILKRAEKRFALEQYNKQINLENIIVGTKENLAGKDVSDEPVDKDWAFRFMNIAQDVSREDMQEMLSKILAEEIKKPNTFSLRTLDFVKNLSKADLQLFKKLLNISCNDFSVYMTKENANDGFFNLTYSEIMQLIDIGFLQSSITTVLKLGDVKKDKLFSLKVKKNTCLFKFEEDQNNATLPILPLTTIGIEIASVMDLESFDQTIVDSYIEQLVGFWKTKKIELVKNINMDELKPV